MITSQITTRRRAHLPTRARVSFLQSKLVDEFASIWADDGGGIHPAALPALATLNLRHTCHGD